MNTPPVTVILPVHNGANYLQESIDSVLRQSCADFELLILDDFSTDTTPQIAQGTGDPRVRYSRNPRNLGLFATLNRGFRESRTPLVRIWAHDDRMLPDCLERFLYFAKLYPQAGMYYCNWFMIDAAGHRTGLEEQYRSSRARTPVICGGDMAALLLFTYGCLPGNISSVMLRKEAFDSVGGFWEGVQQSPDYDMWVRVSQRWPMVFMDEKPMELRCHSAQLGNAGHKLLTTIEEEYRVYEALRARLEPLLGSHEIRSYWRRNRGRQQVHWVVKALLKRNLAAFLRGWRGLKLYGQPWRQLALWLISANGRLIRPAEDDFFDRHCQRVATP